MTGLRVIGGQWEEAEMPKLDDWSWHNGADNFPTNLPPENGGTHMGMFAAWAIHRGLWTEDPYWAEDLERVRRREITGRDFLLEHASGKLDSDDLTAKGKAFAEAYYEKDFVEDYDKAVGDGVSSLYEIEDSWGNYDRVAQAIDKRWATWPH
jgi:hypothetical protein